MKVHTNNFKTKIALAGRELEDKISYTINDKKIVLTSDNLNNIIPSYEGNILKSVMKQIDIDSNIEIPKDTLINYKIGLKVNNDYEFIDFGNYKVVSCEKAEDTNSYIILAYDLLINSMVDVEELEVSYPITIRNYIKILCTKLGLEFANENDEFVNYNKLIDKELYYGLGYKYRDVLDELAQVTASTICINENDKLEIRYINDTNDIIDEEYFQDTNVTFGQEYGPINSIVLSRSANSDNVFLRDEESIAENGLCEIKIEDNQIMNWNNRDEFLPKILEKLNGLKYYLTDFMSTGICYYDLCDRYTVKIGNKNYSCIMFSDEVNRNDGLKEYIFSDSLKETVTDYSKADKTDRRVNQTTFIVDKQNQTIDALVSTTKEIKNDLEETSNNLENNYYQKTTVEQLLLDSTNGLTNTFSEAGGNNILRNTNFSAKEVLEDGQTFEYWYGSPIRTMNNNSANSYSILLQNETLFQEQKVANGAYTLSFFYRKLNPLAKVYLRINGKQYELDEENNYKLFQTGIKENEEYIIDPINIVDNYIKIEFESNINNACELYDIMLNFGRVKLAYSQNQNETVTDTVNIGKGITITSSTDDIKFVANNNNMGFKNSSDKFTTEFTPKGLTTDEIEVKNEAVVVGVLRQRVGEQIWDCMI